MKVKELILSMKFGKEDFELSDFEDCNSDVIAIIEVENEFGQVYQEQYIATFFTFKNLNSVVQQNARSGEFLGGKYFWAPKMVLIDKMEITDIERIIQHLLDQGEFTNVFYRI